MAAAAGDFAARALTPARDHLAVHRNAARAGSRPVVLCLRRGPGCLGHPMARQRGRRTGFAGSRSYCSLSLQRDDRAVALCRGLHRGPLALSAMESVFRMSINRCKSRTMKLAGRSSAIILGWSGPIWRLEPSARLDRIDHTPSDPTEPRSFFLAQTLAVAGAAGALATPGVAANRPERGREATSSLMDPSGSAVAEPPAAKVSRNCCGSNLARAATHCARHPCRRNSLPTDCSVASRHGRHPSLRPVASPPYAARHLLETGGTPSAAPDNRQHGGKPAWLTP